MFCFAQQPAFKNSVWTKTHTNNKNNDFVSKAFLLIKISKLLNMLDRRG